MNVENIKSTLQESIQQFRDINPDKHSYAYIGMKTNNSTSFVERAAKNKLGFPLDPKKVLPLAKLVCEEPQTRQVAKFFADNLIDQSDILKDALYAKFVEENNFQLDADLEKLFYENDNFLAYILSCSKKGTTEEKVLKVGGDIALNSLIELTNKGYIQKINNNYKSLRNNFSYTFKTMKKVTADLLKFYKPSNVGKKRNFIHVVTSDLSKEGLEELQAEHRRHFEKVAEIREKRRGEIQVFSCGFMDVFSNEDLDVKNENLKDILNSTIAFLFFLTTYLININSTYAFTENKFNQNTVLKFTTVDREQILYSSIKKLITNSNDNSRNLDYVELNTGRTIFSNEILSSEVNRLLEFSLKNNEDNIGSVGPGSGGGIGGGGRVINPDVIGDGGGGREVNSGMIDLIRRGFIDGFDTEISGNPESDFGTNMLDDYVDQQREENRLFGLDNIEIEDDLN